MWRTVAIFLRTLNGVPVSTIFFRITSSADAFVIAPRPTSCNSYASHASSTRTSPAAERGLNIITGAGR